MSSVQRNRSGATEGGDVRSLWGAVVMQAKADIEMEPLQSLEYAHAVAFFTSGGEWAHMRTTIGDFLELHRDDLETFGRACINRRRQAEGLEPLPQPEKQSKAHARRPVPRTPVPRSEPVQPAAPRPSQVHQHGRFNPFFPRGVYATPLASGV